jgi:malonyl-CoA/methylmalonyl-CoA synthetase
LGEVKPARPFADNPKTGQSLTYQDVLDQSARYANALVALGVEPGDRVAVQVAKSLDMLLLYIGVIRAGAVFLPLNTAYVAKEVAYFLSDAEPALFVCDPGSEVRSPIQDTFASLRIETMGADPGTGSLVALADEQSAHFDTIARGAQELAAILYTSGTTGRSKGAMLTHANLLSNTRALVDSWAIAESDRLLHALPIFHTHGLFVACNTTMAAGSSMVFLPAFDAAAMIELLPDVSMMMGVPTFYTRLLAEPRLTRDRVAHMRLFVSGSAPLLAETHQQFEERTGHRILERYGMTETNMITSNPYNGERRAGTVGFPLPGVEVTVADPATGDPLPSGEIGSIEVRGPNVFEGYWRMPEKTRSEFRDNGFFITGDLGSIDPDGYLTISGREKDLIISGGFNIYPKEVETVLDAHDRVLESAVIGVPHPDFGEGVVAVIASRDGDTANEDELRALAQSSLARFKQPKRFFFVDGLPRNAMGKVQKQELRTRFKDAFSEA